MFNRESWEECGQREVEEETGMRLVGMRYSTVVNAVVPTENYHYITLFVQGHVDLQHMADPTNLEPDKCEGEWLIIFLLSFIPACDYFSFTLNYTQTCQTSLTLITNSHQ